MFPQIKKSIFFPTEMKKLPGYHDTRLLMQYAGAPEGGLLAGDQLRLCGQFNTSLGDKLRSCLRLK